MRAFTSPSPLLPPRVWNEPVHRDCEQLGQVTKLDRADLALPGLQSGDHALWKSQLLGNLCLSEAALEASLSDTAHKFLVSGVVG